MIAATRTREQLLRACDSQVRVVFLLSGDLFSLPDAVQMVKNVGKLVFVHLDLLEGVSRDAAGVRWIARVAQPTGVLSTRGSLLRMAADEGMHTILRIFLVDSSSLETGVRMVKSASPDFVEVMPALVTRAIAQMRKKITQPIIAGGMLNRVIDVERALEAGAVAASTSGESLWER